jgi:hypothetical protein
MVLRCQNHYLGLDLNVCLVASAGYIHGIRGMMIFLLVASFVRVFIIGDRI